MKEDGIESKDADSRIIDIRREDGIESKDTDSRIIDIRRIDRYYLKLQIMKCGNYLNVH